MVSQAFISGLCPGRMFKDLIVKPPPTSLENLFSQTHNFIREEAINENRLRERGRETKQQLTYKNLPRRLKEK